MSVQDNFERILRSLHMVLARALPYPNEPSKVIVDKDQMLELLKTLNQCVYAVMDEYQVTQESRDRAERDFFKHGDEIVMDASRKAEDVYAASVMYTDEALNNIQEILHQTNDCVKQLFESLEMRMQEEQDNVRHNQLELRSQLQDLADTEKYMKIIEDRNRQIDKEKKKQTDHLSGWEEKSIYANRQSEVRINEEYFEMMGIPLDEEDESIEDSADYRGGDLEIMDLSSSEEKKAGTMSDPELQKRAAEAQVRVNLDSDYFKWKAQQESEMDEETLEQNEEDEALKALSAGVNEIVANMSSE